MPAMDFEVNIDLHSNEIKNVVIDKVSSDPSGVEGQIIYNTTQKVLKYFHDSAWVTLAQGGDLSGYQLRTEKGQANGYAGLDDNSKVPIAQLPVGNAANSLVQLAAQLTSGQVIQFNGTGFVGRDMSGIYTYKGTKATYAELPQSGQTVGDVWNVEQAYQNHPAGTNWAWTGTAWDALGGSIDLSGYQTKANMIDNLNSPNASTYPTTNAVSTVTPTELGYLSGVTSGIQTQFGAITTSLAGKVDKLADKPTAGTYAKVTINAEGQVTGGQEKIAVADISDIATSYIPVGQKGTAGGVATLDSGTKVPIGQIPTGNAANSVPVLSAPGTAGQAIVVNPGANGFEFANLLERASGTITGNGTATSFPIEHGLRGPPVGYVIVNDSTKKAIQAEVTYTDDETITVAFNTAPAIGTNYTVYMVG